jgi:phenylacetic acid degradation operon negative regulatory protein
MKPRSIVFDLFGDYLRYRGGAVALRDLIALLDLFGVQASTARVVMSRLRKEGWFDSRPGSDGREVVYSLNERSWRMLDEGRERIFTDPHITWDGWWHVVIYFVPEASRATREELRRELAWLGFGPLGASTWVSPHDRLGLVRERFGAHPDIRLDLLRSRSSGLNADRDMAGRCWDLEALNDDYAKFHAAVLSKLPHYTSDRIAPAEALVLRTQLLQEWRKFPFRDPGLPVELLPAGWTGHDAFNLFAEAAACLREGAERAVDEVTGLPRVADQVTS